MPKAVRKVLERLTERGFRAFLVGGCVRDMLRGVAPQDFDVATSARPQDVQKSFARVIPTGIQHGTVMVLSGGEKVEVTTFRTEGAYEDGRRPSSVEFHSDVTADLSRRDFTINAMAFDPVKGELVDPFGGQRDLEDGVVRCVGEPSARFAEDGLRPLRAVRLCAALGFSLDLPTEHAIAPAVPVFKKVSCERVRDELLKLLVSARPAYGLELLHRTQLLQAFLPELEAQVGISQDERYAHDVFGHTLATVQQSPPSAELRLAAMLHDVAKPRTAVPKNGGHDFPDHESLGETMARAICQRLKLPNRTIELVATLVRHHRVDPLFGATDAALRRFVARVGEANVEPLFALAIANKRGYGRHVDEAVAQVRTIDERVQKLLAQRPPLSARQLALDGNAIMRVLGVGPSAIVGEATRFLLEQVLDDPGRNQVDRLTELLRTWAKSRGL